jgi:hypothetical protein
MEVILRCAVPDRPGALAAVAGAIGHAGGDIEAVDVVESADGVALDDLVVVIAEGGLPALLAGVQAVEGVEVVHAGPSRGHPGDAVARLAIGLQSLLNGAMSADDAVVTLVGGLLRASSATIMPRAEAAPALDHRTLVLPFDDAALVLRREYRFTHTERERAVAILRACLEALERVPDVQSPSSSG